MTVLISILSFILVLLPLIIFHEFGHYFSAKFFKIKVLEFGFGFPPKLFSVWSGNNSLKISQKLKEKYLHAKSNKNLFITTDLANDNPVLGDIFVTKSEATKGSNEEFIEISSHFLKEDEIHFKEMQWSFNILPLGGFVRPFGEENSNHPESFYVKKSYQRLIVLVSGVLVNFILPFFLFFLANLIPGDTPKSDLIILDVVKDSPAYIAGLKVGDKILLINDRSIYDMSSLQKSITASLGEKIIIKIERGTPNLFSEAWEEKFFYDGDFKSVSVIPRWNPPEGEGAMGISILIDNTIRVKSDSSISESFDKSIFNVFQLFDLSINSIKAMVFGSSNPQFSGPTAVGPVGISQITGTIAVAEINLRDKLMIYVELISILSLSLAVINLLPIPALDGGRILFVLIEILRNGKKVSAEKERLVHGLGFIFMIALLFIITAQDIIRLYQGISVVG
jgi:regulator of sigma E protease